MADAILKAAKLAVEELGETAEINVRYVPRLKAYVVGVSVDVAGERVQNQKVIPEELRENSTKDVIHKSIERLIMGIKREIGGENNASG